MAGSLEHHFERFAPRVSRRAGHPFLSSAATLIVVSWAPSGPILGFDEDQIQALETDAGASA
jgi:low affinity Fe/Cu permease